ncbi:MAG: FAD-dependent monooxygenase, partial [Candidatus Binataceae bacterium]
MSIHKSEVKIPVLIVGGSLVGLSTSLFLGWHGIPSITIEHHRGTAIHPRAAQFSQRTVELFRLAGLEEIVRIKSDEQFVQD